MRVAFQTDLFRSAEPEHIHIPAAIRKALRMRATLTISVSGGKDSQALLHVLAQHPDRPEWTGNIVALHADLGRAEWIQTPSFVPVMCDREGVPLQVVRRSGGDLFDRMVHEAERANRTSKSFWPSARARYCTADLKRGPLLKAQRAFPLVVATQGLRAEESPGRRKAPPLSIEARGSGKLFADLAPPRNAPAEAHAAAAAAAVDLWEPDGPRLILNWLPIHGFTTDQVWSACGTSAIDLERRRLAYLAGDHEAAFNGWPCHVAYVLGNDRLSCALCVLASRGDLVNGARHNPDAFNFLVQLENRTGISFTPNRWLRDLLPAIQNAA